MGINMLENVSKKGKIKFQTHLLLLFFVIQCEEHRSRASINSWN